MLAVDFFPVGLGSVQDTLDLCSGLLTRVATKIEQGGLLIKVVFNQGSTVHVFYELCRVGQ